MILLDLGEDKSLNEVGLGESVGNAALSGLIKIPLGFAYLGAELKDAFAEEGEDVENSAVTISIFFRVSDNKIGRAHV